MSLEAFGERVRVQEEAKWAKVKTPGRIAFVVLVVSQKEFDWMKSEWGEYSRTLPSGMYIGKRWLRREYTDTDDWYMGHYVKSEFPNHIDIQWTPIAVENPEEKS